MRISDILCPPTSPESVTNRPRAQRLLGMSNAIHCPSKPRRRGRRIHLSPLALLLILAAVYFSGFSVAVQKAGPPNQPARTEKTAVKQSHPTRYPLKVGGVPGLRRETALRHPAADILPLPLPTGPIPKDWDLNRR